MANTFGTGRIRLCIIGIVAGIVVIGLIGIFFFFYGSYSGLGSSSNSNVEEIRINGL